MISRCFLVLLAGQQTSDRPFLRVELSTKSIPNSFGIHSEFIVIGHKGTTMSGGNERRPCMRITVQAGDTLGAIAQRFGTTVEELQHLYSQPPQVAGPDGGADAAELFTVAIYT
jgi:hypothetical protein